MFERMIVASKRAPIIGVNAIKRLKSLRKLGAKECLIIDNAKKPVLLMKTRAEANELSDSTEAGDLTQHVLFPTDFSDNMEGAFEYVRKMVGEGVKKITVVHVQDKASIDRCLSPLLAEYNDHDYNELQEIKKTLCKIGVVEVEIKLVYGSTAKEIVRLIREQNISLVVMESRSKSFIEEFFCGSVSNDIVKHSPVPVLLIPVKRKNSLLF